MPYPIKKVAGGYKVVSANHPQGFSKKAQTHDEALAQERALYANANPKNEKKRGGFSALVKK